MALGTKRSASLFAANAEKRDALGFHDSPELDVVPVVVDDTPQRTLNTDASTVGRAHNLFFTPETEGKCHRYHTAFSFDDMDYEYKGYFLSVDKLKKHLWRRSCQRAQSYSDIRESENAIEPT